MEKRDMPSWSIDAQGLREVLISLGDIEEVIDDKVIEFIYAKGGPDLRYMQTISVFHQDCYNDKHIKVSELFWVEWYFKPRAYLHSILGGYLSRLSLENDYLIQVFDDDDSFRGSCNAYHIDIVTEFKIMLDENPNYLRKYRL